MRRSEKDPQVGVGLTRPAGSLCVSGLSQASLSAGHMQTCPSLPASVCYCSEEPGLSALQALWKVI